MKIITPAKINPILYILGKRKDGLHELYMHMVPVGLYDIIKFSQNNVKKLNFRIRGSTFIGKHKENLVIRAVRLFEKITGKKAYLDIFLEKHIPSSAGLGGGSGNAAGTLCALNYIYRDSSKTRGLLSPSKLYEIALELGSDVPFFLKPCPTEVFGRGEKLIPFKHYPKFFVIIIKPHFSISTLEAYKKCQTQEELIFPTVKSIDDLETHMYNQFEKSLFNQYSILSEMKSLLLKNGAFGALVSGSGSAVFGAFREKNLQNQAYKKISCLQIGKIFSCETLAVHCYF